MAEHKEQPDPFVSVTQPIVEALERGENPLAHDGQFKPWNATSGKAYQGFNQVALTGAGFEDPRFMTWTQIKERNGWIPKGVEGVKVLAWNKAKGSDEPAVPRAYPVFNVSEVDQVHLGPMPEKPPSSERYLRADALLKGSGAVIREGPRPAFNPADSSITLPKPETFPSMDHYYATAFQELGKWSNTMPAHPGPKAQEGLQGEMLASMLRAEACINGPQEHNPTILKQWAETIQQDPKAFIDTASRASNLSRLLVNKAKNYQSALALEKDGVSMVLSEPKRTGWEPYKKDSPKQSANPTKQTRKPKKAMALSR